VLGEETNRAIRIRYEETGSGFPLLVTPGVGLNSRVSNWQTAVNRRGLGPSSFPPRRDVHSQPFAYPVEGVQFGGEFALRLDETSEAGDVSREAQRRILDDLVAYHPVYMAMVSR